MADIPAIVRAYRKQNEGVSDAEGANRYKVAASVDAKNSFGAIIRTYFTCVVVDKGNDRWVLESLDL